MQASEKEVERLILDSLAPTGMVQKHEGAGRPVLGGAGKLKIIPFRNKYYYNGHPDISYLYKGKIFYFEVKSPKEMAKISRHWARGEEHWEKIIMQKSYRVVKEQYEFLRLAIENGAYGGFVSSVNCVVSIIRGLPGGIYFPSPHCFTPLSVKNT